MDQIVKVEKKDKDSNVWKIEEFSWTFVKDMPMNNFQYNATKLKELVNSSLSPLEKAVFFTMMYNRFNTTSACLLSKSSTARTMSISYNTANKGIESLVKANIIGRVDGYIYDNRICQFYIKDYKEWDIPKPKVDYPLD